MKKIIVSADSTKSFMSAVEALEDVGYTEVGKIIFTHQFKRVEKTLVSDGTKLFAILAMTHFNTSIDDVVLGDISTLTGEYNIYSKNGIRAKKL